MSDGVARNSIDGCSPLGRVWGERDCMLLESLGHFILGERHEGWNVKGVSVSGRSESRKLECSLSRGLCPLTIKIYCGFRKA